MKGKFEYTTKIEDTSHHVVEALNTSLVMGTVLWKTYWYGEGGDSSSLHTMLYCLEFFDIVPGRHVGDPEFG